MLTHYFAQILFFLYNLLGQNLGLAIIVLTLILKSLLFPITLNSLRAAEKMKRLQPELDNLKKKHKKDPKKLQQAQVDLFKRHKVNPLTSFIPQIIQIIVFIMLYRLLMGFLNTGEVNGEVINTHFLWFDLTKSDPYYILAIITASSQFALSYLMQAKKSGKEKDKLPKKDEKQNMMAGMSKSMMYVMPLISGFFALKFPSGLVVYWITSNLFSLAQQYYIFKTFKHEEVIIELKNENVNNDLKKALTKTKKKKKRRPKKAKKKKKHKQKG